MSLLSQTAYGLTGLCHCLKTLVWPLTSLPNETTVVSQVSLGRWVALVKQTEFFERHLINQLIYLELLKPLPPQLPPEVGPRPGAHAVRVGLVRRGGGRRGRRRRALHGQARRSQVRLWMLECSRFPLL